MRRLAASVFLLPAILAAMDQPSIDGVNTWFVSKAAKEAGLKVALSAATLNSRPTVTRAEPTRISRVSAGLPATAEAIPVMLSVPA